jgi:radical SAM superfamily enzyme YgiQ (UPF0313 family)
MAQKAVGVRLPPSAPLFSICEGMPSKKNILLINPWIYDFTAYDFWARPMGLLYTAALLKKHTNLSLSFIDCLDRHYSSPEKKLRTKEDGRGPFLKQEVPKPRVLAGIPRKYSRYGIPLAHFVDELDHTIPPDLVLLTCTMTYWYPGVQAVAELVRKKFGRVPIMLGGVYPTIMPDHALAQTGVDVICRGPAEKQIFSLINEVLGDGTCPDLRIESLEGMPIPAFSFLRDTSTLPMLTSRGCPLRCSFCASFLLCSRFEQRSVGSILRELEVLCHVYNAKNIAFYDDALLLNKQKHIIPLLEGIIEKKYAVSFHTPNGLHVGEIDRQLAALLQRAGFKTLYLSQETFEESLIEESCPKVSSGDLSEALGHLETAGFERRQILVYLMVGLPDQDVSAIKEGIRKVRDLGARPHLAYFSPIPGTPDWEKMVSRGYLENKADPLLHNKIVFPYTGGTITPDELESLKKMLAPL